MYWALWKEIQLMHLEMEWHVNGSAAVDKARIKGVGQWWIYMRSTDPSLTPGLPMLETSTLFHHCPAVMECPYFIPLKVDTYIIMLLHAHSKLWQPTEHGVAHKLLLLEWYSWWLNLLLMIIYMPRPKSGFSIIVWCNFCRGAKPLGIQTISLEEPIEAEKVHIN